MATNTTNAAGKLLQVQQKIGAIKKDKVNPHFKNSYFDINGLLDALKPVLSEQGLVLSQPLTNIDGKPALRTLLVDSENGEVAYDYTIGLPEVVDPQKFGSAVTYFRRYCLQSLFALESEDDDGNRARPAEPKPSYTSASQEEKNNIIHNNSHESGQDWGICPVCSVGRIKIVKTGQNSRGPWTMWGCTMWKETGCEFKTFEEPVEEGELV